MKYLITKFKNYYNHINESYNVENINYDESIIDSFYKDNFDFFKEHGLSSVIDNFKWGYIYQSVDELSLTNDWKKDYIENRDNDDLIDYIQEYYNEYYNEYKSKYIENINKLFIESFSGGQDDEFDEKFDFDKTYKDYNYFDKVEKIFNYDESYLIDIVEKSHFYSWVWDKRYDSVFDYINEIYMDPDNIEDKSSDNYTEAVSTYFTVIENYIDEKYLNKIWISNISAEVEKIYYFDNNKWSDDFIDNLIDYDLNNIIYIFNDISNITYFNTYEHQKDLIISMFRYESDINITESDNYDKDYYLPDILFNINEKYNLVDEIKKEYNTYIIKITTNEFNI